MFYRTSSPSGRCPASPHYNSQSFKAGQRVSLTTYCPWATCFSSCLYSLPHNGLFILEIFLIIILILIPLSAYFVFHTFFCTSVYPSPANSWSFTSSLHPCAHLAAHSSVHRSTRPSIKTPDPPPKHSSVCQSRSRVKREVFHKLLTRLLTWLALSSPRGPSLPLNFGRDL